jgi:DNA-directed RNA polymerase subunit RPC12/RpoP
MEQHTMILFACPACKARIQAMPNQVGSKSPCPRCGQRVQVPSPSGPTERDDDSGETSPVPPSNKTVLGEGLPSSAVVLSRPTLDREPSSARSNRSAAGGMGKLLNVLSRLFLRRSKANDSEK